MFSKHFVTNSIFAGVILRSFVSERLGIKSSASCTFTSFDAIDH